MNWLSKYLVRGLIVIVPISLTVYVVVSIFEVAERLMGRHLPIHFPGIGLFAVVGLIVGVGWLTSNLFLRRIIDYGERVIGTIPVIKFFYNSIKQIATAIFESQQLFKQAVLVTYPYPGSKVLGFVMHELSAPLAEQFTEEHVCVFIPFSLNMTAGLNIIVPKREIIALDVSSESALQYVLTAGAIMPQRRDVAKE